MDLKKIFYNPKNAYPSAKNLYKLAKKEGLKLSHKEVKDWYNNQQVNQLFKGNAKPVYEKIQAFHDQPGTFQADLMDVSRWQTQNDDTTFLLNVVDIFSRYAWSIPLTSKSSVSGDIADRLADIYKAFKKKYPNNPLILEVDNGGEFKGRVNDINDEYDVKVYKNNPSKINSHTFMSIVERFNKTLLNKMKKHMYSHSLRYIDNLEDFVNSYNNTIHSTIKDTPNNIFNKKEIPNIYIDDYEEKGEPDLVVGDMVRIIKKKATFAKKSITPNVSTSIYQVVDIIGGKYRIQNLKKLEPNEALYIRRELEKIPDNSNVDDLSEIKKEIKKNDSINRRKRRNKREGLDVNKKTGAAEPPKRMIPPEQKRISKPVIKYIPPINK